MIVDQILCRTGIDNFGRFKVIIPLKAKCDTSCAFKWFKGVCRIITEWILCFAGHQESRLHVKWIWELKGFEIEHGIARHHSVHLNRTVEQDITAMLSEAVPLFFWREILASLLHVLNWVPTFSAPLTAPFGSWFKHKANLSNCRIWGYFSGKNHPR